MNMKITIAILLLILSLAVFIYSLLILIRAFTNSFPGFLIKLKLKRLTAHLEQAKSILTVGDPIAAKKSFMNAFCLDVSKNMNEIEIIFSHNNEILTTLGSLSKDYSLIYRAIPVLEELLLNRKTLCLTIIDTNINRKNLKKGFLKKTSWALSEFDKKIKELNLALDTNKASIMTELNRLFEQFDSKTQSNFH